MVEYTIDLYCYVCLDKTETKVTSYRAYILSECLSCHHVRSNTLPLD